MNLMYLTVGGVIFLLAVGLGLRVYKAESQSIPTSQRFKRKAFFSNNEKHFFTVIQQACADEYIVCPQVSMGALVDVDPQGLSDAEYWDIKKQFAMKIVDYVLCNKVSLDPVLLIELDDKSHQLKKDINRDAYTSKVGLKTLRLWSRDKPNATKLKSLIQERLKG